MGRIEISTNYYLSNKILTQMIILSYRTTSIGYIYSTNPVYKNTEWIMKYIGDDYEKKTFLLLVIHTSVCSYIPVFNSKNRIFMYGDEIIIYFAKPQNIYGDQR